MKGFMYLIEIAVAGIMIAVIINSLFSAQYVKTNWSRAELIGVGNDIANALGDTYNIGGIFDKSLDITKLKPPYMNHTLKFYGIPDVDINIGTNNVNTLNTYLQDTVINKRKITYRIEGIDDSNIYKHDVIVLIDNNGANIPAIKEFSEKRGVVCINADCTQYGENAHIIGSDPTKIDEVTKKYFKGVGLFDMVEEGDIKTVFFKINTGEVQYCIIDNKLTYYNDGKCGSVVDSINVGGYDFFLKYADITRGASIVPSQEYVDNYFLSESIASGTQSYFALIKATVLAASINNEGWYLNDYPKEPNAYVPSFITFGDDIPETAEMDIVLWYTY